MNEYRPRRGVAEKRERERERERERAKVGRGMERREAWR
jgi:hypothetical protein